MPESLFNKVAGLRPATLLKKRLWHRCFPVNFLKTLRTPFLQNTSGRLLLILIMILVLSQVTHIKFFPKIKVFVLVKVLESNW